MSFRKVENRRKLAFALIRRGFKVRYHAYEYFIRFRDKFVCTLSLFASRNLVIIYKMKWNKEASTVIEDILEIIMGFDPKIQIKIL